MEKSEKLPKKIGEPGHINEDCWLTKNLNYAPYSRCQYCKSEFRNCLFLHYQIISSILILLFLTLSFLIEGNISELVIFFVFTLVIIYGYFFNKSTDKIIQANFAQRKAKEDLEELTEKLQEKIDEQTKEIKEAYRKVEKSYEVEKRANKELKRLDEVKSQFMLATQHHLRTPLTSIQGYLDLLLGGSYGKISKKLKEILGKLQTSSKNEIKIVEDLLNISQFQLGKKVVVVKPGVEVEPIMKEIVGELQYEAQVKKLYLTFEKSLENIPLIVADREKLKVALANIIDNAIKYTRSGGITIKTQITGKKLQIIIKDTGIGLTEEEKKTLFSKLFERGVEARKVFATGRGIGLFITNKIIEAHNGRIWVESEGKGKGSEFHIELPIF